jgi:hypothetical protein
MRKKKETNEGVREWDRGGQDPLETGKGVRKKVDRL